MGCTVQRLSAVGRSVPDLLVGCCGLNVLIEVKNPDRKGGKENAHGTLAKQRQWRETWRGAVYVAHTPQEAVSDVARAVARFGERIA